MSAFALPFDLLVAPRLTEQAYLRLYDQTVLAPLAGYMRITRPSNAAKELRTEWSETALTIEKLQIVYRELTLVDIEQQIRQVYDRELARREYEAQRRVLSPSAWYDNQGWQRVEIPTPIVRQAGRIVVFE